MTINTFHFSAYIAGFYSWQATYNRIPLLKGLLESGFRGWVCYLDADAYIADLNFDAAAYLADKINIAFIAESGGGPAAPWWNVNAGVFLINFAHPVAHSIVHSWSSAFETITDQQLVDAIVWDQLPNDQSMLHASLRTIPEAHSYTLVERGLINYAAGSFIKQYLRASGNFDDRVEKLREDTDEALAVSREALSGRSRFAQLDATQESVAQALYRAVLLREPDPPGLANAIRAMRAGKSIEDTLRSCFRCDEFATKHLRFIDTYVKHQAGTDTLTILADRYGSDKGTKRGAPPHRYTYLYDLILDKYRNAGIDLLELGLAVGGPEVGGEIDRKVDSPSIQMWLEYFPRAHVHGFDISDFSHIHHPRFTFVRGDGGSSEDLQRLAKSAAGFDVVIDDGSHASYHQQLAFLHI